jgi:hypothetical protein
VRPQAPSAKSFLIRVWLEHSAGEDGGATWRGHITELPNGRPVYFEDLSFVTATLARHLEEMGAATRDPRGGGTTGESA